MAAKPSPADHGRSEAKEDAALARALSSEQERLGTKLRALRVERELSQETAAERARISPKHLRRLELGQANVTLVTLIACARAYGVTLGELFADAAPSPRVRR